MDFLFRARRPELRSERKLLPNSRQGYEHRRNKQGAIRSNSCHSVQCVWGQTYSPQFSNISWSRLARLLTLRSPPVKPQGIGNQSPALAVQSMRICWYIAILKRGGVLSRMNRIILFAATANAAIYLEWVPAAGRNINWAPLCRLCSIPDFAIKRGWVYTFYPVWYDVPLVWACCRQRSPEFWNKPKFEVSYLERNSTSGKSIYSILYNSP